MARRAGVNEHRARSAHPARAACFMRPLSAPVALDRMRILLCARYAVLLGASVSAGAHVDVVVWVPEAVQKHPILELWKEQDIDQLPSDILCHVTC